MIKEIKLLPRKQGSPGNPPRQLVLECDHCHSTFERLYATDRAKQTKHFCSSDCTYAGRAASPLHGRKTTRSCSQCAKDVTRMTSFMEGKEHIFCDRECLKVWKITNTPPECVAAMSTPEARAKSKASLIKQRSAPGYVHSMSGHVFTDESRAKMRESGAGKHVGALNGMHERNHTEESCAKMSDTHSRLIVEGRRVYGNNGHACGWHTSPKGNAGVKMFYRSSWERDMMIHLDSNDDVPSYGYECVRIPYYDIDNHKRNYVPDFLVTYSNGRRVLIEIKPKQFLNNEKTVLKAEAARAYCEANGIDVYEILTGEDLRSRQIVK